MPYYNNYYGNPYMQSYNNPYYQPLNRQMGLQGKTIDSVEVVKGIDIPLDGSISYFPLADGSAIVTKQLRQDGTSKTLLYKLVEEDKQDVPKYAMESELDALKQEIEALKKQIQSN